KHRALKLKQYLARAPLPRAVLDEPVTVERAKREELLDVEPLLIGEETVNRTHTDDPRPRPGAGPRRPGADLAEPLEGDSCPREATTQLGKRSLRRCLDTVPGGEVVHSQPLVASRPQRKRIFGAVEEIGRKRPHVGAGQEDAGVWLQRALVRGQHRRPVAASETDAGLGARIRHAVNSELPRHRPRQAGDLVPVRIGQHPRSPHGHRKELVIDNDNGIEATIAVAELDNAHGLEPTPSAQSHSGAAAGARAGGTKAMVNSQWTTYKITGYGTMAVRPD